MAVASHCSLWVFGPVQGSGRQVCPGDGGASEEIMGLGLREKPEGVCFPDNKLPGSV